MSALATRDDYEARYGSADEQVDLDTLLEDASSLVQEAARQTIARVDGDVELHEGNGSDLLCLYEQPVVAIDQITVDGRPLDPSGWRLLPGAQVRRIGGSWPAGAAVEVTYTHGHDPVPGWIVSLVCGMVQRSTRPDVLEGVQQQTTGSQSISYRASTAAGAALWVTEHEAARLRAMIGPVVV